MWAVRQRVRREIRRLWRELAGFSPSSRIFFLRPPSRRLSDVIGGRAG